MFSCDVTAANWRATLSCDLDIGSVPTMRQLQQLACAQGRVVRLEPVLDRGHAVSAAGRRQREIHAARELVHWPLRADERAISLQLRHRSLSSSDGVFFQSVLRVEAAHARIGASTKRIMRELDLVGSGCLTYAGWSSSRRGGTYRQNKGFAVIWTRPSSCQVAGSHIQRLVVAHEVGHHEDAQYGGWSLLRPWAWRANSFPSARGLGVAPGAMTNRSRWYAYGSNVSQRPRLSFDAVPEHFAEAYAWLRMVSSPHRADAVVMRSLQAAAAALSDDGVQRKQASYVWPRAQAKLARQAKDIELFLRHDGRGLGVTRRRRLAVAMKAAKAVLCRKAHDID